MRRMTRTLIMVLLGMVVMLATALTVTATQRVPDFPGLPGRQSEPPVATPAAGSVDPAASSYTIPRLSLAQKEQVGALAQADPQVVRLLQAASPSGLNPQVSEVAVWHTKDLTLIGGVVTITLGQATTLEGDWPGVVHECHEASLPGKAFYMQVGYREKYSNVTSLLIFVDLNRGQVVGINPGPGARLEGEPVLLPGFAAPPTASCDKD